MAFEDQLNKGEKVVYTDLPSPWNYWFMYLIAILLSLTGVGAIIGIPIIIIVEVLRRNTLYAITNKRIIHYFSFLATKVSASNLTKVQDIQFHQGIIAGLVNIGTLRFNTAGTPGFAGETGINFKGIRDPFTVKKTVEKLL